MPYLNYFSCLQNGRYSHISGKVTTRNWNNLFSASFVRLICAFIFLGYAYATGICMGGGGVSVIQESGLYSWAIAAHELGHR